MLARPSHFGCAMLWAATVLSTSATSNQHRWAEARIALGPSSASMQAEFLAAARARMDTQVAIAAETFTSLMDRYHNHYHYMPKEKVLVCSCAKCGSTSLYDFVFREAFGRAWNYTGPPFIQDVTASRWAGKFKLLYRNETESLIKQNDTFSLALVRDPKKRIISAWKSKIACDPNWGTDVRDREGIVPKLLTLANRTNASCLSLYHFLDAVYAVHKAGKARELNSHFRPQHFGCFRHFPPQMWRKVVSIADTGAAAELAVRFGDANQSDFPHVHTSNEKENITISPAAMRLLDAITVEEYKALGLR